MTPILLSFLVLPGPTAVWETLAKNPTHAECTTGADGQVFCRSTAVFEADIETLGNKLEHLADHADKFDSIVELNVLEPDVYHVVMDFPFPLSDRDYVARYTQSTGEDGSRTVSWTSVAHAGAPESDARVRLTRFEGAWHLAALGADRTTVVYTWHGEYGGALPNAALSTARKKTAVEAIKDLAKASGGVKYAAP
jgi:hypothetical protein